MARTLSLNRTVKRRKENIGASGFDPSPSQQIKAVISAKMNLAFHRPIKRDPGLDVEPNTVILISDDEDDDNEGVLSTIQANNVIVISDDDEDEEGNSTVTHGTNGNQVVYVLSNSDVEMEDAANDSFTALSNVGDKESDNSSPTSGVNQNNEMIVEDENNITRLEPTQQTSTRKRSREISSGDDSTDETIRDDNDDNNYMKTNYPWWRSNKGQCISLHNQVLDFLRYLQPKKHEILLRHYLVHKIQHLLASKWEGVQVNVFGSFTTNTFLPDSDIDMVVTFPNHLRSLSLYSVSDALKKSGVCRQFPRIIGSATVPVLKCVDALTSIKIDIILYSQNGVECATYMSNVLDRYPCSRELTLMVKHLVALRYLHTVYTGGMGGLSLTCLVIRFLQTHSKVISDTIDIDQDLGDLLLEFFEYYGAKFDLGRVSICITDGGSTITKGIYRGRHGERMFSIMHPLDRSNDIGSKSFLASSVTNLFNSTYLSMKSVSPKNTTNGQHLRSQPGAWLNPSCLLSEIGRIPAHVVKQRALMEEVYLEKKWNDDPAAATFDWNMAV
ncbi:unnamed protein product [Absidia cylindrospora]